MTIARDRAQAVAISRAGSPAKRTAILVAARELFLRGGFEGTSVDAVAAAARVSKRTVYDYFGDKQALFAQVLSDSARAHAAAIESAVDDHLIDVTDLERALTDFAVRISTVVTATHLKLSRLVAHESLVGKLPQVPAVTAFADGVIAERLAEFARRGLLDVPDPRLAADHYVALAGPLAFEGQAHDPDADPVAVHRRIVEGVRVFLRAYEPRF